MWWIAAILLLFVDAGQSAAVKNISIQSRSRQFLVQGKPSDGVVAELSNAKHAGTLRLDPVLLAVSAERIKGALLELLQAKDAWRSQVVMTIHSQAPESNPLWVHSVRFLDGWRFHIDMPPAVDRTRLVRTLTKVLLLEMAHRGAGPEGVELPPWLPEGLSAVLLAEGTGSLTLEPLSFTFQQRQSRDPLRDVRQQLQAHPPLTLDQLNWPEDDPSEVDPSPTYTRCAHLFVHELLRLKTGPEALQTLILRDLPGHLNWQTAFLKSYEAYFPRWIDLDKWWSLLLVQVAGHELSYHWSWKESWDKLEAILATPVEVRLTPDELPMVTQASLQSIVREWSVARQHALLQLKLNHLHALRLRMAPELAALVDEYRRALQHYVERLSPAAGQASGKNSAPPKRSLLLRTTLERLDELDAQRLRLAELWQHSQQAQTPGGTLTPP